ncbi:uncharacterized protein ATC70_011208 [Mucor velutinosus]|uniref:ubiquitinyl hydrolase 1 n=1 Tax=Mucor velutinosus TaxID=708070 RepID=A0AAN7DG81_9FUNG|nr:hypothetical protein ATC70_011208 [Mucor velutinosus]
MNTHLEKWALIPSDPAIFEDMIQQYGIEEVRVEEVFALDLLDDDKDNTDIHGLIFISRYVEEELPTNFEQADPLAKDIVFTAQVVTNICATLALLAVLLNANINKGHILNNFLRFTEGFSSIDRGMCLGYCQEIRSIHDAYAGNAYHIAEDAMDVSTGHGNANCDVVDTENYHYISYIYKNGFVWELDGLKNQPLRLQGCTHEEWITRVKPIIQQRMQDRVDVSLMAITKDNYHAKLKQKNAFNSYLRLSKEVVRKRLAKSTLPRYKKAFFQIINEADTQYHDTMKDIWISMYSQNYTAAEAKIDAFAMEINPFNRQVDQLTAERERAKANSTRQKFDYFPFVQAFFKSSFQYNLLHDPLILAKRKSVEKKATEIPTNKSTLIKRKPTKKTATKVP